MFFFFLHNKLSLLFFWSKINDYFDLWASLRFSNEQHAQFPCSEERKVEKEGENKGEDDLWFSFGASMKPEEKLERPQ